MLLPHPHFTNTDHPQGPAGALRIRDGRPVPGRVPQAAAHASRAAEAVGAASLLGREGRALPGRRPGRTVPRRAGQDEYFS